MSIRHARFRLTPKREAPEYEAQKHCVTMLRAYMPDLETANVWWGASLSGVPLSPHLAGTAKKAGLQRGALDVGFIFPDGRSKYIEMKDITSPGINPYTLLTAEQAIVAQMLGPTRFAICASWDRLHPMKPVVASWLAQYGLRLLTDTESVRREGQRRQAEMTAKIARARPLRRRPERASVA